MIIKTCKITQHAELNAHAYLPSGAEGSSFGLRPVSFLLSLCEETHHMHRLVQASVHRGLSTDFGAWNQIPVIKSNCDVISKHIDLNDFVIIITVETGK